jgi:hypothetical protein
MSFVHHRGLMVGDPIVAASPTRSTDLAITIERDLDDRNCRQPLP